MQEKLIPFRSQSHSLNEFYRQVISDINSLYGKHNQLEADTRAILSAARVQEAAVASKIQTLKSEIEKPALQPDGLWRQRVAATVLKPDIHGLTLPGYGLATVKTETEKSCLTVSAKDGTVIVPQALKVEVSPNTGHGDAETDPLCAIHGNKPWWRQVSAGGETNSATVVYTVHLPVEVLDDPAFNQIRIVTFPLYTVTVESIEYLNRSIWRAVDAAWPEDDGIILLPVQRQTAQAVRVTLRQSTPQYFEGKPVYHVGLALFDVVMAIPVKEKATFTATVDMAGIAPWKLERVELSPDLPNNIEWEISSGNTTIRPHNLPADIIDGKLKLTISISAMDRLYRPALRHIELYYRDSSSGY